MSKAAATAAIALVITASVPTFRRANLGFTDKGTAFAKDDLTDEQLSAIQEEPRLSVREMPADAIPEGVDTDPLRAFVANTAIETATKATATEKKTPPAKGGKAENAGA